MAYDNLNGFLYLNYSHRRAKVSRSSPASRFAIQFTGYTSPASTTVTSVSSTSGLGLIAGQFVNWPASAPPGWRHHCVGGAGNYHADSGSHGHTNAVGTSMSDGPRAYGCDSINQFTSPLNDNFGNGLAVDGAGNVYTAYGTSFGGYIAQFPRGSAAPAQDYSTASMGVRWHMQHVPGSTGSVALAADDAGQIFVDTGPEICALFAVVRRVRNPTREASSPWQEQGVNGYNGDNGTATLLQIDDSEGVAPRSSRRPLDRGHRQRTDPLYRVGWDRSGRRHRSDCPSVNLRLSPVRPAIAGQRSGRCGWIWNPANPTDTIQTNHLGNITLLNPVTHKLYIAYSERWWSSTPRTILFRPPHQQCHRGRYRHSSAEITQMVLDSATNDIWAINSAGQVLEINSVTDQVIDGPFTVATGAMAQAIAVDSKLTRFMWPTPLPIGITSSYHVAVLSVSTGTPTTIATLSLNGPAQAMVADSAHGVAYVIAQDPYSACPSCPQYDYDIVAINGTTANKGIPDRDHFHDHPD